MAQNSLPALQSSRICRRNFSLSVVQNCFAFFQKKKKLQKDISFNSNDLCYHDFQELSLKTCRGLRTLHQG